LSITNTTGNCGGAIIRTRQTMGQHDPSLFCAEALFRNNAVLFTMVAA